MANKSPFVHRGLNMVFVVFSLLAMGGAAYIMSTANLNYKTSAGNLVEQKTGVLVKKGTPEYSPCNALPVTQYNRAAMYGLIQTDTRLRGAVTCLILSAQASIADPLLKLKVTATGTLQNTVFYATKIEKFVTATPTPISTCREQCPGTDGVLRNCHPPESDGTSQDSLCNLRGRVEFCGTSNYCCPAAGGRWTTDMTACNLTPQP